MKIRELTGDGSMKGIKVRTADGIVGYWTSQWQKGVWLSKNKHGGGQVYPQFVDDLKDALEWEVAGEDEEINLK